VATDLDSKGMVVLTPIPKKDQGNFEKGRREGKHRQPTRQDSSVTEGLSGGTNSRGTHEGGGGNSIGVPSIENNSATDSAVMGSHDTLFIPFPGILLS